MNLSSQFRSDETYSQFLQHFRSSCPPQSLVDTLNCRRLTDVFPTSITNDLIELHCRETPDTMLLVMTNEMECLINCCH